MGPTTCFFFAAVATETTLFPKSSLRSHDSQTRTYVAVHQYGYGGLQSWYVPAIYTHLHHHIHGMIFIAYRYKTCICWWIVIIACRRTTGTHVVTVSVCNKYYAVTISQSRSCKCIGQTTWSQPMTEERQNIAYSWCPISKHNNLHSRRWINIQIQRRRPISSIQIHSNLFHFYENSSFAFVANLIDCVQILLRDICSRRQRVSWAICCSVRVRNENTTKRKETLTLLP